jgi:hypothetical protein
MRFESAKIESIFSALDAIAWLDLPDLRQIAQFAGIDPRTAGKLLKNCVTIGIVEIVTRDKYRIVLPYPYKGSPEQKEAVIREAIVRMPLMVYVRQFLNLGDKLDDAVRKAATVVGVRGFNPKATGPLLKWASQLDVLRPDFAVEDLVEQAFAKREHRRVEEAGRLVAFISHTSKDKPFTRQLATDLTKAGVSVWLDEQHIMVGDSITQRISQGLANADFFLIALSDDSVRSEWVKKELSAALLQEVEKRQTVVLPIKLSECEIPELIKDKKYADFSRSYKEGLQDLLAAIKKGANRA